MVNYVYHLKRNFACFLLLGILISILIIFLGDYKNVIYNLKNIKIKVLLILISLTFVNQILRFVKWEYLRKIINIDIEVKKSFLIFFSGFIFTITPAKIGEFAKAYFLKKYCSVRTNKGVSLVALERLNDVIGVALLALMGISSFFFHIYSLAVFFIFIFAVIIFISNESLFSKFMNLFNKFSRLEKHSENIRIIQRDIKKAFRIKALLFTSLLSSFSWFFECLALYILLLSLNSEIPLLSATFIFSFSSIFGSVLVLPGGLGAAEASFMGLLLLAGVDKSVAALSTIIIRIATLWFGVFVGIMAFIFLRKNKTL